MQKAIQAPTAIDDSMLYQIAEKIKFDDERSNLYCCYLTFQNASYFDDLSYNRIYLYFESAAMHNHVKCLHFADTVWTLYHFLLSKKSCLNKWYNYYSNHSLLQVASEYKSFECVKYICDQLAIENCCNRDPWRITISGCSKGEYRRCLEYISSTNPNEKEDAEEQRLRKIKRKEERSARQSDQRQSDQRYREQKLRRQQVRVVEEYNLNFIFDNNNDENNDNFKHLRVKDDLLLFSEDLLLFEEEWALRAPPVG